MIPTRDIMEVTKLLCTPDNRIHQLELFLQNPTGTGNLEIELRNNPAEGMISYTPGKKEIVPPRIESCSYPIILRPEYIHINASSEKIRRTLEDVLPPWMNEGYQMIFAAVSQRAPHYAVLVEMKNSLGENSSKNGVYRRRELCKHPKRIDNWSEIVAYCGQNKIPMYDCRFR